MAHPDPTSRRLRGLIGLAVREGRSEDEAALRRELALRNVERCIEREVGDRPLTVVELDRLRSALEAQRAGQKTPTTQSTTDDPVTAVADAKELVSA